MRFVQLSADQRPFTHDDPQLGLRPWLESQGHEFVVSDDKEGAQSFLNKNITDVRAQTLISLLDIGLTSRVLG